MGLGAATEGRHVGTEGQSCSTSWIGTSMNQTPAQIALLLPFENRYRTNRRGIGVA